MIILFLTSSMEGGGAERVAGLLTNAWAEQGHAVTLMPTFSSRGSCVYPVAESVNLDFLSDHCVVGAGRFHRLMVLRQYIKRLAPDIIVSFLPHVNIAALLATRGLRIPVVACERTYPPLLTPPLPIFYRVLRRLTYPAAAALVAQTRATASWMRWRAPWTKIFIIANPVILPMTETEPVMTLSDFLHPNDKLILWAGRMDAAKRADIMIEAFERLPNLASGWKLVMLGDGPMKPTLQATVASRDLQNRILLPGFAGNLRKWYERADLYVSTSRYEGFPNSLLEAMAHGVASIAFDIKTGPAELSDKGRRLLLLPDNNHVDRLIEGMHRLMDSVSDRSTLAGAGIEVQKIYSKETILGEWDALFGALLETRQLGGEPVSSYTNAAKPTGQAKNFSNNPGSDCGK